MPLRLVLLAVKLTHFFFDNSNGAEPAWRADSACASFIEFEEIVGGVLKHSKMQWPHASQVVLGSASVLQVASSRGRRAAQRATLQNVLDKGRLSDTHAGHLVGTHGFLNSLACGRVGRVAVQPLFHRQHNKDRRFHQHDELTPELSAAMRHLIEVSGLDMPRIFTRDHRQSAVIIGDAFFELNGRRMDFGTSPGEVRQAWDAAAQGSCPALSSDHGIAVAIISGGRAMWLYFEVPHSVLGAFRKRLQYITLLEALPVLAAVTVWGGILAEQFFLYYGDNEGSMHCFTKGYSRDADLNLLVGIFLLRAAAEGFVPWCGRVSSKDNFAAAGTMRMPDDGVGLRYFRV